MAKPRHLPRAPIAEALWDIRVVAPHGFTPDVLKSARERHKDQYPHAEERTEKEARFELAATPPTAQLRELGFQGLWLWSQDRKSLAQFKVDGFTFNRLEPYTSWESLYPEAMHLWRSYVDLVHPEAVTRLAVRYINRIELSEPVGDLAEYLTTTPRIPQDIPQVLNGFLTRVVLEHPQFKLSANVTQALEHRVDATGVMITLDIDAYRTGQFAPLGTEVDRIFGQLRQYKNEIFFGSVTDRLLSKDEWQQSN